MTSCVDCTEYVELEIGDVGAECPRCGKEYEVEQRNGHQRLVPVGDDTSVVKQRLSRIREWTEGGNPGFGGAKGKG